MRILLDLNFGTSFRELLLQVFCVLLGHTFLHRLRGTVNEVFRLFQSQSGELFHELHNGQFVLATGFQDHVEAGLRGWRITTGGRVIQQIPEREFRFLVHWGANVYMNLEELKMSRDHTDDITHETAFEMLIRDLRARGEKFEVPSDPMTDKAFIALLTRVYDVGLPLSYPPEPEEAAAA